jgi:hypothetical protein
MKKKRILLSLVIDNFNIQLSVCVSPWTPQSLTVLDCPGQAILKKCQILKDREKWKMKYANLFVILR